MFGGGAGNSGGTVPDTDKYAAYWFGSFVHLGYPKTWRQLIKVAVRFHFTDPETTLLTCCEMFETTKLKSSSTETGSGSSRDESSSSNNTALKRSLTLSDLVVRTAPFLTRTSTKKCIELKSQSVTVAAGSKDGGNSESLNDPDVSLTDAANINKSTTKGPVTSSTGNKESSDNPTVTAESSSDSADSVVTPVVNHINDNERTTLKLNSENSTSSTVTVNTTVPVNPGWSFHTLGIALPLDTPVWWLALHCSYWDHFLHIIVSWRGTEASMTSGVLE